jgi:hypothetical protein
MATYWLLVFSGKVLKAPIASSKAFLAGFAHYTSRDGDSSADRNSLNLGAHVNGSGRHHCLGLDACRFVGSVARIDRAL